MMAHVDYPRWAQLTVDLLAEHGLWRCSQLPPRLLECGCGTGTLALLVARYGVTVEAFDKSPEMIAQAAAKVVGLPGAPTFRVGSFEQFQSEGFYDAALCLYDSINYILEPNQFIAFLRRLREVLRPGGLLLFDVCTELNSILHFDKRREVESGPGYRYARTMRYRKRNRIQENVILLSFDGPPPMTLAERHLQRIYPLDDVRRFIAAAGFMLVEETDGYERRRPGAGTLRVHFLVRKPPLRVAAAADDDDD